MNNDKTSVHKQHSAGLFLWMILISLAAFLLASFSSCSYRKGCYATKGMKGYAKNANIIKTCQDERGLISVIFYDGVDTMALDYLTEQEMATLVQRLSASTAK